MPKYLKVDMEALACAISEAVEHNLNDSVPVSHWMRVKYALQDVAEHIWKAVQVDNPADVTGIEDFLRTCHIPQRKKVA